MKLKNTFLTSMVLTIFSAMLVLPAAFANISVNTDGSVTIGDITVSDEGDVSMPGLTVDENGSVMIFSDLYGTHQNAFAINFLKNTAVIGGYPDGTFRADNTVNRAELAKMLVESHLKILNDELVIGPGGVYITNLNVNGPDRDFTVLAGTHHSGGVTIGTGNVTIEQGASLSGGIFVKNGDVRIRDEGSTSGGIYIESGNLIVGNDTDGISGGTKVMDGKITIGNDNRMSGGVTVSDGITMGDNNRITPGIVGTVTSAGSGNDYDIEGAFTYGTAGVETDYDLSSYRNCFPDVSDQWFAPYVCYAKEKGWVDGYSDGYFRPDQTVNKIEAVKMVINANNLNIDKVPVNKLFADTDPNQWYNEFLQAANQRNLLVTSQGAMFYPSNGLNRGYLSEYIFRGMGIRASGETTFSTELQTTLGHIVLSADQALNASLDDAADDLDDAAGDIEDAIGDLGGAADDVGGAADDLNGDSSDDTNSSNEDVRVKTYETVENITVTDADVFLEDYANVEGDIMVTNGDVYLDTYVDVDGDITVENGTIYLGDYNDVGGTMTAPNISMGNYNDLNKIVGNITSAGIKNEYTQ